MTLYEARDVPTARAATLRTVSGTAERFLGIDSGGTQTRWVVLDGTGAVLARGEGPPIQPASRGVPAAAAALASVLADVAARTGGRADCGVAGIAGAGAPCVRDALRAALAVHGVQEPLRLCGDPEIAAATALADGPGVAVWSGTGSFAVARAADGRLVRVGGRGYLLGDRGSGFAIVRAAAEAAVRAADGVGPPTALSEALVAAFAADAPEHLGARLQALAPREVAARLPQVLVVVAAGDAVARAVLDGEARELVLLTQAAAIRAGLGRVALRVGGGVFEHAPAVRAAFESALRVAGFTQAVELVPGDCARGAARLARALWRGEPPMCGWLPEAR
jgi:N-acetylglucosamine kinase-like BadF-type ATPase